MDLSNLHKSWQDIKGSGFWLLPYNNDFIAFENDAHTIGRIVGKPASVSDGITHLILPGIGRNLWTNDIIKQTGEWIHFPVKYNDYE